MGWTARGWPRREARKERGGGGADFDASDASATRGTPPPRVGTRRRREAGARTPDFNGGARHGSTPPRASANPGAAERSGFDSRGRQRLVHTKGAHTRPEAVQVQQTCHTIASVPLARCHTCQVTAAGQAPPVLRATAAGTAYLLGLRVLYAVGCPSDDAPGSAVSRRRGRLSLMALLTT